MSLGFLNEGESFEGREDKFDYSNILFTCLLLAFGLLGKLK